MEEKEYEGSREKEDLERREKMQGKREEKKGGGKIFVFCPSNAKYGAN